MSQHSSHLHVFQPHAGGLSDINGSSDKGARVYAGRASELGSGGRVVAEG